MSGRTSGSIGSMDFADFASGRAGPLEQPGQPACTLHIAVASTGDTGFVPGSGSDSVAGIDSGSTAYSTVDTSAVAAASFPAKNRGSRRLAQHQPYRELWGQPELTGSWQATLEQVLP